MSLKPPIKELTLHTSISGSDLEACGEIFSPPHLLESYHSPLELFRHFVTPSGSHSPRNRLIHACLFEIDDHSIHLRKHLSSFDSWGTCRRPSVLRLLRFVVIISPQIFSTQIHSPKTFYVYRHMHRSAIPPHPPNTFTFMVSRLFSILIRCPSVYITEEKELLTALETIILP